MGILDQLKQEAAEKQKLQESQTNLQKQREDRYRAAILPAMQKAFKFMQELVEYLNFLEHAVVVEEYSNQYPQFGQMKQQDYKIYTDNHGGFADVDRLMQINVRFFCVGFGSFSYNLEGQNRIEREVAFLTSRNVHFDWKLLDGRSAIPSAVFTITRRIPVRFRFEVDYDNSKIHLLINNHENFNAYKKAFAPEDVNDELLDEIARFMLRKDSDFIRLEITSVQRQRIKNLVEQKRREELALLRSIPTENPTGANNDKALGDRLRALVKLPKK
ncbi:hypothetical protein [Methylomonas rapida]|uniref:Uncharacterized protein n=1 Tax=Methylomonas rapida TaxID=2963939 RepID=A0ABY7GKQ2_9GAMM|nr:hypothetical protein [Methylomonas rapida]WAR45078.1 hypothetical protein NM686_000795 [Methylomonas rapida]